MVKSESIIKSEDLYIESGTGGLIEIEVKTKRITIDTNLGAISKIKGVTQMVNIESNTGAVVNAFKLIAKNARVEVSMGANVQVNCTEKFDGSASMGGIINVKGNPAKSYENESMGGAIYDY